MTYRPLNHNEQIIVSNTIYEERGLTGGLAESMFLAYKARAMALDEPEFAIFQESEVERKAMLAKKERENVVDIKTNTELQPMDFLRKLEALSENDTPNSEPKNKYEWFYGDESKLDTRHKRLRVKFFNSPKYRTLMLQQYVDDGILTEAQTHDTELVGKLIGEFHRMYPGTRQGIISNYEIFFGDPSGFSYSTAMNRKEFHSNPEEYLSKHSLPKDWSIQQIKSYLKDNALETGAATLTQIECWERNYKD